MKRALTKAIDGRPDRTLEQRGEQWWVTNPDDDGQWLPVSRAVEATDEADVRALFNGNGRTKPMTFARRCLSPVFGNEIVIEEDVAVRS